MLILRGTILLRLCALLFVVVAYVQATDAASLEGSREGFGLVVVTKSTSYSMTEPIPLTLEIFSHGPETVDFQFANAQRFDIVVFSLAGEEVWRWSDGRMFAAVLGTERLNPDRPSLRYKVEIPLGLGPGRYRIEANLMDRMRSASAVLTITVE